ncbi:glycosyltransferase [Pedobacter sp. BMA]|uniref:glycosyltransferase n=1 Tax=Pedobacter sp. BMA TaxID=1663685 RepID=UPI0006497F60|nr:glycosyltransferase [Pedobacter sp. BMA]KLT66638.1 hypothetical protein AB669_05555 [Pedobacter sp. BMA]
MRILLIMDPGIPVPPKLYGGHERLVSMFADAYNQLGHEVSLLAGPDSNIKGKTFSFGVNDLNRSKIQKSKELFMAWNFLINHVKDYDVIHNFGRLLYLLPVLNSAAKKIMTYGRPVSAKGIRLINKLPNQNLYFTACSNYCVSTGNVAGKWETVYNAIDFSDYKLNQTIEEDAPLMFLGRLDKIKGLHTAISVAKKTGHRLLIGGNLPNTADNYAYFKQEIEPHFNNSDIIYLGALNDEQKNKYLGQCKALLFPIEWDEPFGMVMVEAMACGTPVIAFNRGSVPEIIVNGENGYIVSNEHEMIEALLNIHTIDRSGCRYLAKSKYNVDVIAKKYLLLVS